MAAVPDQRPSESLARVLASNVWFRFVVRRLIGLALVMLLIVVVVFLSVRLIPGDPASALAMQVSPAQVERARKEMGLDQPIHTQFFSYLGGLFQGDMGTSLMSRRPVSDVIFARAGNSLQLAGVALAVTLVAAVPLGILVGSLTREGRHRRLEVLYQGVTQFLATLPEFLLATTLAFVFAVQLGLLPVAGGDGWRGLALPVLALSLGSVASLSRFVRIETLNVLAQDYIRTARSKSLPTRVIYARHVLPNVLTSSLTIGGLLFAIIIGGSVIVENVFNRPGIGTILTQALNGRDYPLIQGITLMLGAVVVISNAVVDFLLAIVDKRSLARHS